MELKIELSKGDLLLKAKDETYLAVRTYLVDETSNKDARYEMQADERDTHERKLLGAVPSAVARFKSFLYRYCVYDTLSDEKDKFTLTIVVSDRFHGEREQDVKRLMEQYIYREIVSEWWEANYPKQAGTYTAAATEAIQHLLSVLSLSYPEQTHNRISLLDDDTQKRIRVNTTLFVDEILDDVHAEILSIALGKRNDAGLPDVGMETDEYNALEQLKRSVQRWASRAVSTLSAYLVYFTEKEDDGVKTYHYTMDFPPAWRNGAYQLTDELHSYIVFKTVADYLAAYDTNLMQMFSLKGDDAISEVKFLISVRRPGFNRRPMQPF